MGPCAANTLGPTRKCEYGIRNRQFYESMFYSIKTENGISSCKKKIMFSGHKFKYLVVNDDIYNLLPKTSQGKGYLLCDKCLGAHYPSLLFCILESFHNCFYIN